MNFPPSPLFNTHLVFEDTAAMAKDDLIENTSIWTKDHVALIRAKVQVADGLGPFWRGMMLAALDSIDAQTIALAAQDARIKELSEKVKAALFLIEEITDREGREGLTDFQFAEQVIDLAQTIRTALQTEAPLT